MSLAAGKWTGGAQQMANGIGKAEFDAVNPTFDRIAALERLPDDAPVVKQHVVSKVLLQRFAHRDRKDPKVRAYTLAYGKSTLKSPGSIGYFNHFVRFRSAVAEKLWQDTENRLSQALRAVDDRTIFSRPEHVETIKRAIVLHYFRTEQTRQIHETVWDEALAQTKSDLLKHPERLRELARQRFGAGWDDSQGLTPIVDDLVAGAVKLHDTEVLFQARLEDLFRKGQDIVASRHLEISESVSADFILGDSPAVAFQAGHLWPRVALLDAGTVALPLSRTKVASLGPADVWQRVDNTVVERLNVIEIQQANRQVYFHPLSNLDAFIRRTRPPSSV